MVPQPRSSTHAFPLSESVNIPRRLAEYKRGDRTLFVAITKASFIVVGPIGAEFIYLFEEGVPLGSALSVICNKHGRHKEAEIRSILSDLLIQIETRQFYQDATVKEDIFSPTLLMRLTNRCNLRCTHCLVSSSPDWPIDNELTTAEWCAAAEQYATFTAENGFSRRKVTITGGEALSRRDALEIAQHAKSLGLYTDLFSNGTLIVNSRIASAIAAAVNEVQISFDGATAEVHDCIRGEGMFMRTMRGVRLLREANVRFRIALVVMPQNYDDLMAHLGSLVRQLGDGFNVSLGIAVQRGRATESMSFASVAEGEEKVRVLRARLVSEGVRAHFPTKPNLRVTSCGYGRELTINSDGLVYGCGPQRFPMGNLKTESLLSIAARTIHRSRHAEIDLVEGCRDCNIRYLCGGTCRLNNIASMGRANMSSCDHANKEEQIDGLFRRASAIVPLRVLQASSNSRPAQVDAPSYLHPLRSNASDIVPLSALLTHSKEGGTHDSRPGTE